MQHDKTISQFKRLLNRINKSGALIRVNLKPVNNHLYRVFLFSVYFQTFCIKRDKLTINANPFIAVFKKFLKHFFMFALFITHNRRKEPYHCSFRK
ncbi:MAG: hypothetical protein A3F85_00320 [Candidatus Ryanbacteria bacterium RIFCSPLOWO2_12_FULL_44_26]|nr:MAG: hypothetical protein A3F85_00320 [Candidatus Ryanbacteria bacterium RIFCSPLOWO2_12_FULL_44_26]